MPPSLDSAFLLGVPDPLSSPLTSLLSAQQFHVVNIPNASNLSTYGPQEKPCLVVMAENFVQDCQSLPELLAAQFPLSTRVLLILTGRSCSYSSMPADFFDRLLITPENASLLPRQIFEIKRLFELKCNLLELELFASSDPLTGLRNKRYFEERLSAEIERARRYERDLSLILMDVDGLKKVNDLKGHLEGDEVLVQLAHLLRSTIRSTDLISRWAGDEFTLLLTETNLDGAKIVAERLRQLVLSDSLFQDLGVTLSLGIADFPNLAKSKDELKRLCDQSLVQAKNRGRNRIFYPGAA